MVEGAWPALIDDTCVSLSGEELPAAGEDDKQVRFSHFPDISAPKFRVFFLFI